MGQLFPAHRALRCLNLPNHPLSSLFFEWPPLGIIIRENEGKCRANVLQCKAVIPTMQTLFNPVLGSDSWKTYTLWKELQRPLGAHHRPRPAPWSLRSTTLYFSEKHIIQNKLWIPQKLAPQPQTSAPGRRGIALEHLSPLFHFSAAWLQLKTEDVLQPCTIMVGYGPAICHGVMPGHQVEITQVWWRDPGLHYPVQGNSQPLSPLQSVR